MGWGTPDPEPPDWYTKAVVVAAIIILVGGYVMHRMGVI